MISPEGYWQNLDTYVYCTSPHSSVQERILTQLIYTRPRIKISPGWWKKFICGPGSGSFPRNIFYFTQHDATGTISRFRLLYRQSVRRSNNFVLFLTRPCIFLVPWGCYFFFKVEQSLHYFKEIKLLNTFSILLKYCPLCII
jgi:hypothetical protein